MTARIWPGALCEVRHAIDTPELDGRFVIAERRCFVGDRIGVRTLHRAVLPGEIWVVSSAVSGALLPWATGFRGSPVLWVEVRPVNENLLFPILPPPGSDTTETDDRAPCEVEPAQPDRVSA